MVIQAKPKAKRNPEVPAKAPLPYVSSSRIISPNIQVFFLNTFQHFATINYKTTAFSKAEVKILN